MTTRTDTQIQQRALVGAFRSLVGIWPFLSVLGFGAGGVWFLSHQWDGVGKVQDAQATQIEWHAKTIAASAAELKAMQADFAMHKQEDAVGQIRLEGLIENIRIQLNLRPVANLPAFPSEMAGSAPGADDLSSLPPVVGHP